MVFLINVRGAPRIGSVGRANRRQFIYPFNPSQSWGTCGTGYKLDQYHMQMNPDFNKYHNGEDWNGICGGPSDYGARLDAMADGQVVYVNNTECAR